MDQRSLSITLMINYKIWRMWIYLKQLKDQMARSKIKIQSQIMLAHHPPFLTVYIKLKPCESNNSNPTKVEDQRLWSVIMNRSVNWWTYRLDHFLRRIMKINKSHQGENEQTILEWLCGDFVENSLQISTEIKQSLYQRIRSQKMYRSISDVTMSLFNCFRR